jgi:hypothetical protein
MGGSICEWAPVREMIPIFYDPTSFSLCPKEVEKEIGF